MLSHDGRTLLNGLPLGLIIVDRDLKICELNQTVANWTKVPQSSVLGSHLDTIVPDLKARGILRRIQTTFALKIQTFLSHESYEQIIPIRIKRFVAGSEYTMVQDCIIYPMQNENDEVDQVCLCFIDVTAEVCYKRELEELNKQLESASQIDPITNLLLRSGFDTELHREVHRARRHRYPFSILLIEVRTTDDPNTAQTNTNRNEIAKAIAKLLTRHPKLYDIVARVTEDRYAIILSGLNRSKAEEVASKLLRRLSEESFRLSSREIRIRGFASVVEYQFDLHDRKTLFLDAEAALDRTLRNETIGFRKTG